MSFNTFSKRFANSFVFLAFSLALRLIGLEENRFHLNEAALGKSLNGDASTGREVRSLEESGVDSIYFAEIGHVNQIENILNTVFLEIHPVVFGQILQIGEYLFGLCDHGVFPIGEVAVLLEAELAG